MPDLTHIDETGRAAMVDVADKATTKREAVAEARVRFPPEVYAHLAAVGFAGAKGSLVETARLAGVMAAKRTSELIPLCHPLPLTYVDVAIAPDPEAHTLVATCTARCTGRTGVEMEALTGASVAALTIYDMAKALSHAIVVERVRLVGKRGGESDFGVPRPRSSTNESGGHVD